MMMMKCFEAHGPNCVSGHLGSPVLMEISDLLKCKSQQCRRCDADLSVRTVPDGLKYQPSKLP